MKQHIDLSTIENVAVPTGTQSRVRWIWAALVTLLTCMTAQSLRAQSDTGAITGTVTDASGAVVQGVSITATNSANGLKLSAVTGSNGGFNILAVPRGDYTVETSAKGFAPQSILVTVTVTETQDVAFQLQPAGISTTVEVVASAPLIDTSNSAIGATIHGAQVTELPLNGRNFSNLALLTPGVTRGAYGDEASGGGNSNTTETERNNESGSAALSVNGLRPQADNYILDGVDNNDGLVNTILFFSEYRCDTGIQGEYQRGSGRIWPCWRGHCCQLSQVRFQRLSRFGVLVLSQRQIRLQPRLPVQRGSADAGSIF